MKLSARKKKKKNILHGYIVVVLNTVRYFIIFALLLSDDDDNKNYNDSEISGLRSDWGLLLPSSSVNLKHKMNSEMHENKQCKHNNIQNKKILKQILSTFF